MFDVWLPVKWHWRTVHFRLEESNAFSPDRSEEDVLDLYHSVALMAVVVAVATVPVCFISSLSRSKWLVARLFVLVVKYQLLGLFAFYMERGRERERERNIQRLFNRVWISIREVRGKTAVLPTWDFRWTTYRVFHPKIRNCIGHWRLLYK